MRTIEQIVWDTKKPGEAILAGLTAEKCDLWHAGTLLACELSELSVANCYENEIEEYGDIYYAIEMIERHVGSPLGIHQYERILPEWVDDFLSPIKAHCIYGKELDMVAVAEAVAKIKYAVYYKHRLLCATHQAVVAALDAKLSKRHPTGYSDKNAIERKDKA